MHGKPGSYVRRLGVLPVVVCFLMCCIGIQGSDVWPLVLTGNLVPGTADYRFTSFSTASVNASGTIAFHAGFTTPDKVFGDGIFKIENGELIPIILSGQLVPDSPGTFFGATGDAAINSRGDVAFIARTTGVAWTIFVKSGAELRRVVDLDTPVPGVPIPGEQSARFLNFFSPRINDQGDVVFGADTTYRPGIFLYTQEGLIVVTPQAADRNDFSLNNRGEVAFLEAGFSGVSLFSQGQSHLEVPLPQSVPGVSQMVLRASNVFLNDTGDIAFTVSSFVSGPRGGIPTFPAIVRWHNGVLEKIAASGDDVPRFTGSKFTANFRAAGISRSAVLFSASTSGGAGAVVGRFEGGELTTLASDRDFVDGIGTLDFVGSPAFDLHDGKPATFLANAAMSTSIGIYAAAADPRYTLRFPHIADGGGNSGSGWSTKFVFGNRSADNANTTVSFYDDSGVPLYLTVGGQQVSQISLVVPARGVASIQTEGGSQLKTGWAIAETDASLSGIAIFGLLDGGRAISEVGSPASLPLRSFSVFVQGGGTSTGVALANPNSVGANITLILRDANSVEVARISLVLPPMGHLGRYVNELFPGVPLSQFEGKVEVVSSQALAGLTLRQHELAFTSLPVIP